MKLSKSKKANVNYLAKIVEIKNFRQHSNPEVTRLKCCTIDGFNIITGIDSQPGLYVYFPTACCINPDFLRYCNLYRHKELNNDPEQTGMFHVTTKRRRSKESARSLMNNLDSTTTQLLLRNVLM